MDITIKPINFSNKLVLQRSGEDSIESQLGNDMTLYPAIWDESPNGDKKGMFKVFATYSDTIAYIESFKNIEDKTFHEVIYGDRPQRLRFDIDAKGHLKTLIDDYDISKLPEKYHHLSNHDAIIQYLKDLIYDEFIAQYSDSLKIHYTGYTLDKDQIMVVTECHNKDKYSFHIIVTRFKVHNYHEARYFAMKVAKRLKRFDSDLEELIDIQTYKHRQFFRILGCCKRKEPSRIKKLSKKNMNERASYTWLSYGFIQHGTDDMLIHCKKYDTSSIGITHNDPSNVLSKETVEYCKEVINEEIGKDYKYESTKNNMLTYKRIMPSYCKVCKKKHDQENAFAYVNGNNLFWNCRRNNDKHKVLTIGFIEDTKYDRVKQLNKIRDEIVSLDGENLEPLHEYKFMPNCIYDEYCAKHMRPFPKDYDTLYIKAPMKMGKSKQLIAHIKSINTEENPIKSILIVSFRRAFTEEFLGKFNTGDRRTGLDKIFNRKLEDYKTIKDQHITKDTHPFVMVQIESFHRIRSAYDTVILDESESIYEQFSSSTVKQTSLITINFMRIIRKAKRVICMDAYLDTRTVENTNRYRGENKTNIKFSVNTFKNQGVKSDTGQYTYNIGYCTNHFYKLITEALEAGKKIVILSNTRDKLNAYSKVIAKAFPDLDIQSYTALSKQLDKQELKDVNYNWSQYDVVMYSPTITAGISYEKVHFDQVFCLFSNMSCNVLSCMQMIGRVRNVGDKLVHICYEHTYFKGSITADGIVDDLVNNRNQLSSPFNGTYVDDTDSDDDEYFKYIPNRDGYFYLWLNNQISSNKSKQNFLYILMRCIYITGANIEVYEDIKGEDSIEIREAQKEVKRERYNDIAEAKMLSEEEFSILLRKSQEGTVNRDMWYSLEKYGLKVLYENRFIRFNSDVLDNIDYIESYYPSKIKNKYKNIKEVLESKQTFEHALEDIRVCELNSIKTHYYAKNNQADLNINLKANLHKCCYDLIKMLGFDHIIDFNFTTVNNIINKLTSHDTIRIIRKCIDMHGIRRMKLKKDGKKPRTKERRIFDMSIDGISKVLDNFYGIAVKVDKDDSICLEHKHGFHIVRDTLTLSLANEEQPIIIWKGFKVPKDWKPIKYEGECNPINVNRSQNDDDDDDNDNLDLKFEFNSDSDDDLGF
uniref:Replication origin-binding protein domain-containing protein n=1 Tax=viral metagenome TaxID=1070528 RepID=A0A6C0LJW5_9ZZZZ